MPALRYWIYYLLRRRLPLAMLDRGLAAAEERLAEQLPPPPAELMVSATPEIDAEELSPERFHELALVPHKPLVIRGFAQGWPALEAWTPEALVAGYGDELIPVRLDADRVDSFHYTRLPLAELVRRLGECEPLNVTGIEDIFNRHSELRSHLDLGRLNRYLCPRHGRGAGRWMLPDIFSTELFLSNQQARTSLHCAFANNLFVMVHGRKKWTQIDPTWSRWVYSEPTRAAHYATSRVDYRLSPAALDAAGFPLFRHVPRLTATLEPGDAIFSPQWWWHAVENEGLVVGVAARGLTDLFKGHPLFSVLAMASAPGRQIFFDTKRFGWANDKKVEYVAESWD